MPHDHKLNLELPRIGCDFNAKGLSDEPADNCFYSFDRSQTELLPGSRVVLYGFDTSIEITACEALIEPYRSGWLGEPERSFRFCGFRARPIDDTWYSGPIPWQHAL